METGMRHTHLLSVVLFLLIYLIKTFLLLSNKNEALEKFTKKVKVPEMIVSTLFLVTGIYMLTQIPEIKSLLIIKIIIVFTSIPIAVIGFRKKKKALAVISFIMIVSAYGLAEKSKTQMPKAMETITKSNVNGKDLYDISCTPCHGTDGKKGISGASDLSSSILDPEGRFDIIKNGKGAMGAFRSSLNDEQIHAVAEYIETLRK